MGLQSHTLFIYLYIGVVVQERLKTTWLDGTIGVETV